MGASPGKTETPGNRPVLLWMFLAASPCLSCFGYLEMFPSALVAMNAKGVRHLTVGPVKLGPAGKSLPEGWHGVTVRPGVHEVSWVRKATRYRYLVEFKPNDNYLGLQSTPSYLASSTDAAKVLRQLEP